MNCSLNETLTITLLEFPKAYKHYIGHFFIKKKKHKQVQINPYLKDLTIFTK